MQEQNVYVSDAFVDQKRGVLDGGSHVCRLCQFVDALKSLEDEVESFGPIHVTFYQNGEVEKIPLRKCSEDPENVGDEDAANQMGMSYEKLSRQNGKGILRTGGFEINFDEVESNPFWDCITDCLCCGKVRLFLNGEWVVLRPMIDFDARYNNIINIIFQN